MSAREAFADLARLADAAESADRDAIEKMRVCVEEISRIAHAAEQVAAANPSLGVSSSLFGAMRSAAGLAYWRLDLAAAR